jgi:hypothetical protein
MILEQILNILISDTILKGLLKSTVTDAKIYMNSGRSNPCISYKFMPVTSDGIKRQDKLEINCISNNYAEADEILKRVKQLLLTLGDRKLNNDILEVALNGGGYLKEENTDNHIIKAFFIIKSKERI